MSYQRKQWEAEHFKKKAKAQSRFHMGGYYYDKRDGRYKRCYAVRSTKYIKFIKKRGSKMARLNKNELIDGSNYKRYFNIDNWKYQPQVSFA